MADLTHDGAEDGFHEIQLSGKQLVFLFMATTVVCVVIFLCGVLVGRGVRTDRAADDAPDTVAASPTPAPGDTVADAGPPAAEPPAPAEDELSYKKRLEGESTPRESLKPEPKAPAAAAATPPAAPPAPLSSGGNPGTWVVQLTALRDHDAANTIVRRLSAKGYPAFLVPPPAGAPARIYRVQVGRYNDRREAEQVASRLKKEEQFDPWISR